MSRTPSKARDISLLVLVVVVAAALVAGGSLLVGGTTERHVDGRVQYYTSDGAYGVTLGPNGWFAYDDDDDLDWVEHAPSGKKWGGRRFYGSPIVLTSDGAVIAEFGGDVRIERPGGRTDVKGTDLLVALGDKRLRAGRAVKIIGLSTRHVAVVTCMSPGGDAGFEREVDGGRLVVSGVALADGAVSWSHDTGRGCGESLAPLYPQGLPEQEYVLLTPEAETTQALDLDTGRVARTWRGSPRGRVIVRGDEAIHRSGDEVSVISLRTGRRLSSTSCPGARLDNPGDLGGRLATDATPLVRCGDSVRLLDGDRVVTVDAPPVEESQQVPDGGSVVHDRFEISRRGDVLTLRDALEDRVVGEVEVPVGYRIPTNDLRGRLIAFFLPGEARFGDGFRYAFRVVDTRTAELVATTSERLSPGAEVSTDGFAVLSEREKRRGTRGRRLPSRSHAWLVGVEQVQRGG